MRRLSGLDASFLYLETPHNHMHVAATYVFGPGLTFERVREVVENRLHLLPPFRRRLVEVPFGLHHPLWVEDPDFDLDFHVRRAAVRAPGTLLELEQLAADLMSRQLDRRRPLWELYVVEGLAGGGSAIISKTHHAAVDGVSGAELTANLFDLDAQPVVHEPGPWSPERIPSEVELLAYSLRSIGSHPARLMDALRATARAVSNVRERVQQAQQAQAPVVAPFDAPRTSLNVPITAHRAFATARFSLADVKTVRTAFGGTVNDVVLALCGSSLRAYLLAGDELPEAPLTAMVPISVRTTDQRGTMGNRVAQMLVGLGTDVADPVDRLHAITARTSTAKELADAIGADTLANWVEFAAPAVAARAARLYTGMGLADRHRPLFNVTVSNVPGPSFELFSAGSPLREWYPMGPIFDGTGCNITVMSYRGVMHVGVVGCPETVRSVRAVADGITDAMDELLARTRPSAGGARSASARRGSTRPRTASGGASGASGKVQAARARASEHAARATTRTAGASTKRGAADATASPTTRARRRTAQS